MITKAPQSDVELLRTHGLKATPQRLEVLRLLAQSSKPISIAELQKATHKGVVKTTLDTVTLYRSLETLVEKSLVRPVDLRHGHTDFELVREGKHHHHIVCTKCGAVADFEWCPEDSLKTNILTKTPSFASLADHSLEFFGLCKNCA